MPEPDELSGLVVACARGDRSALNRLYLAASPQLFGIALRIVRRRDLAEDVLHEAFLQVWRHADRFDPTRGEARHWIVAIVRYRAFDALRRIRREITSAAPLSDDVPDSNGGEPAEWSLGRTGDRLTVCLGELADTTRRCIVLAYAEGLSHSEIASRVDAPLGTVKSWIRRGLAALKGCIER